MRRRQLGALALFFAVPLGRARAQDQPADRSRDARAIAFDHVTVLPMTGDEAITDATVLIEGDRITAITGTATAEVPEGTRRVDASGKWLLPGLTDMHVHIMAEPIPDLPYGPEESLSPFLANGVLQIVDMASSEHTNTLRDDIAAGIPRAPRLVSARMVDGDPPIWGPEIAMVLRTPDEARQAVTDIVAAGYDFIKVYSRLDLETFVALLEEAQAQGIRVIGHIPAWGEADVAKVVRPGLAMVAHAEEFAFRSPDRSDAMIAEYVALALDTGLALTSTLFLNEQLAAQTRDPDMLAEVEGLAQVNPIELSSWFEANRYTAAASPERIAQLEDVAEFNQRLVKAFVDAGIPVLAGTDTGVSGLAPGYALPEELQALARAGLTNIQILQAATSEPARWLGVADDLGTVEVGKRANLLILDADPREDIGNTRAIAAIVLDGQLILRAELDSMMTELDALYTPLRALFSPQASEILAAR